MYYATLIQGASYYAFGQRFMFQQECQITKRECQYLQKNDWFQIRKEEVLSSKPEESV
ncbi:YqbF domain-containing protein [Bacillus toyonensis]|uniref:Uncharacterized protein YqbF N-terminal domain-containing protein n=1 Tax=Bacillus toyonensis TaxID=155322 RepID=A0A2A8HCJ0_9BACI|nr:YqbF domain-containing protein [Bacillus toyonensis]PEQ01869.1 hypothetical protein CN585_20375 [Bacillus toyonensis]